MNISFFFTEIDREKGKILIFSYYFFEQGYGTVYLVRSGIISEEAVKLIGITSICNFTHHTG